MFGTTVHAGRLTEPERVKQWRDKHTWPPSEFFLFVVDVRIARFKSIFSLQHGRMRARSIKLTWRNESA